MKNLYNPKLSKDLADALSVVLADTYTLYLKTHNYHWNVTGPHFLSLHTHFETQYTELALAVDAIAERIRTLGHKAPGSYKAFAKLSAIKEAADTPPEALEMVRHLAEDQVVVIESASKAKEIAEKLGDEASIDLMIQRVAVLEKTHWMLKSILG